MTAPTGKVFVLVDGHNVLGSITEGAWKDLRRTEYLPPFERIREIATNEGPVLLLAAFLDTRIIPPLSMELVKLGFKIIHCPSFQTNTVLNKETVDQELFQFWSMILEICTEPATFLLFTEDRDYLQIMQAARLRGHTVVVSNKLAGGGIIGQTADRFIPFAKEEPEVRANEPVLAPPVEAVAPALEGTADTETLQPTPKRSLSVRLQEYVAKHRSSIEGLKFRSSTGSYFRPTVRSMRRFVVLLLGSRDVGPANENTVLDHIEHTYGNRMGFSYHKLQFKMVLEAAVNHHVFLKDDRGDGTKLRLDENHRLVVDFLRDFIQTPSAVA